MKQSNIVYRALRCIAKERGMEDFLLQYYNISQTDEYPKWFSPEHGLCFNYLCYKNYYYFTKHRDFNDLTYMFEHEGFEDPVYPFGCGTYHRERYTSSHHKNPKRIAWVRKTLHDRYSISVLEK